MTPLQQKLARRRETYLHSLMGKIDIDLTTGCWVFNGSKRGKWGYFRDHYVHIRMWEITHNSRLDDLKIGHTCGNPLCCNPAHLYSYLNL